MNLIFWLFWIIDLAIALLSILGKDFRRSFTPSDLNFWFTILNWGCLIGSLYIRLILKRNMGSLALAAFPILVLFCWYLFEKLTGYEL